MIITLKGADFSASNIGTLSSWRITRSLGSGATYAGPTSVDKGAAFSATVTLAEGYEIGAAGVTITMGGTVLDGAHAVVGNVITIAIPSVTGNVLIKVPTINTATGEEEEPEVPDEPAVPSDDIWYVTVLDTTATDKAQPNYASFAYNNNETVNACIGVPINAIRLCVAGNGSMSYGKLSSTEYTKLGTITLKNASEGVPQIYKLSETVTLAEGERMWFGTTGDKGLWYYKHSSTNDSGTFARGLNAADLTGTVSDKVQNLCVDIGYING
jgi:hypothetical protein